MNDNINFRSFKQGDYETCVEWWKWWWKRTGLNPVQRALLPSDDRCFMIEKNGVPVAAYFLLVFEFRLVAFTTYLVTNPNYKEKDRREVIKLLVTKVEKEAEKIGVMQLFTILTGSGIVLAIQLILPQLVLKLVIGMVLILPL